jgi:exodeoxyribonuclease VII small subunit
MTRERKTKDQPSFESKMKKLETIVTKIESGEMGLEDTLKYFEEGMGLARECQELLNQTELRIQKLVDEGGTTRLEPLDAPGDAEE